MSFTSTQFKKLAISAAHLANEKLAEEISLLDLRKSRSGVADYLLVLSANSQTHINALHDYIQDSLLEVGVSPLHREGRKENLWHVLDYGGLVVHIFHQQVRPMYALERLWEDAKPLPWNGNGDNGNGHRRARAKAPKAKAKPSRKPSRKKKRS